eukprot:TRINITY_DN63804_c0_g1_i1.p1 TRINITY_DN63804_c0_g1~~TRINITY_DN63804_c0_g1_i1.p1  ORF type:complete len:184 (+),score=35.70 TRINITY_DN63804_c0_g1_i1:80-631(+)
MGLCMAALPPANAYMATWTWQVVVLLTLGFATACGMVPSVPQVMMIAEAEAAARGLAPPTEDVVLSCTYTAFTLGEMLGPVLGSFAVGAVGFASAARAVGALLLMLSLLVAAVLAAFGHCSPRTLKTEAASQSSFDSASSPLIERRLSRRISRASLHGMDASRAVGLVRAMSGSHGESPHEEI